MTRSDERGTWCLKVIKRPPCDNILASNLLLRPSPSARHRSIGTCFQSLSSYKEAWPCMATDLNNLVEKEAQINAKNFCHNKPNVCFHQKIHKYVLVLCKLVFILSLCRNLLSSCAICLIILSEYFLGFDCDVSSIIIYYLHHCFLIFTKIFLDRFCPRVP